MSFIERTAKKLYPILVEVKKKMVREKTKANKEEVKSKRKKVETLDVDDIEAVSYTHLTLPTICSV